MRETARRTGSRRSEHESAKGQGLEPTREKGGEALGRGDRGKVSWASKRQTAKKTATKKKAAAKGVARKAAK